MLPAIASRVAPMVLRRSAPTVGRSLLSRLGGNAAKNYARKTIITDATIVGGSRLGKIGRWLRKPGFMRDFLLWTGASTAVETIFGADDPDKPTTEQERLQVQQYLNSLVDDELGYTELRNQAAIGERDQVNSSRLNHMMALVNRNLFRKGRIAGKVSSNDLVVEFADLTDAERMLLNNQLVGLIKLISASSQFKETVLLGARQALCSINPSPVSATGSNILYDSVYRRDFVENQSALLNHTYEGLVEAMAQDSFDEAFDEGADMFWDFFDLFGSNQPNDLSEEVTVNMMLTHLNYKGSPTDFGDSLSGYLRDFATDSDGQDDESATVRKLQDFNRVHPRMRAFINSMLRGEMSRADAALE